MCAWGGGGCSCTRVWPSPPFPLLNAVGAREMMGRVAGEVSRPLQVKDTHSDVYRYIHMPRIYAHVCIYTI